ncbi:LLM class flavin-dependent oxidoreductase [Lysinibacillus endophyticus]|uniref:LLM class flavin-dependent oxidoreductase n=1 Tax=Ureibacillus endophyticus TaxID=1978490 RepID=A0A494YVF3_9BACL|nr:LLM class flavin-dependent oxidoreductase [Lysinibacillus endophyticus]MCP1144478.1 LLM class flavin-dependent oxidoreductase [Lysinibacillus endophyticus]RKQ14178.1 LLM class flavin-dependent oxidoreductase [Lysinibacillus endophyticus]
MSKKQLKLGAFFSLPGQHFASWRFPTTQPERSLDLDYFIELAKIAERGKFDTIFFADGFGQELEENSPSGIKLDPIIIQSALAAVTKNIGLVATVTTSYNEPFQLARKFIGIDHLSKGRAAWNVVTSNSAKEAPLFGRDKHLAHAERYERAGEFVDVVKKLWQSIDKEALVIDKESGKYLDLTKVHPVNHEGKWFKVKGTLDAPTSPQGHPVVVQAGSSEAGKELAARTADVVFTAWQTLEEAQAFYRDLKGRLAKYGRNPEDLKIMPGVFITVAKTEEEAIAKRNELNSYILPEVGLKYLSFFYGADLTGYDVEGPLPEHYDVEDETNPNIRANIVRDIAKRNNIKTIRELYEFIGGGRGHREIVGTPEQIADQLQEWFENDAADGFNVLPPTFPDGLNDIVDLVIPELQRRGIFRTEYEGTTLRENLGLKIPTSSEQNLTVKQ